MVRARDLNPGPYTRVTSTRLRVKHDSLILPLLVATVGMHFWVLGQVLGNGAALFVTAGLMVGESIVVVARGSRMSAPGC